MDYSLGRIHVELYKEIKKVCKMFRILEKLLYR